MTREQYDALTPFLDNMGTAHRVGYTRNIMSKDRKRLLAIYKELTGLSPQAGVHCSACLVGILQELYALYVNFTDEPVTETVDNTEAEKVVTVRRGRKKSKSDEAEGGNQERQSTPASEIQGRVEASDRLP
jgi:hypothetical protein